MVTPIINWALSNSLNAYNRHSDWHNLTGYATKEKEVTTNPPYLSLSPEWNFDPLFMNLYPSAKRAE